MMVIRKLIEDTKNSLKEKKAKDVSSDDEDDTHSAELNKRGDSESVQNSDDEIE
jgi:hypothetical protein